MRISKTEHYYLALLNLFAPEPSVRIHVLSTPYDVVLTVKGNFVI